MMNKVVITDSAQFQEVINSLETSYNKLKDVFANQKKNAEEINSTDTWSGAAAGVMYNKYKLLTDNFSPIENSLEIYIKFLKKTLEDYTRLEQEITRNMEEMASNMDVVS